MTPQPVHSMATEAKGMSTTGNIVAVCVVAAWLGMLAWLGLSVDAQDRDWARMIGLLASIEAVAFAAAGALLGTTVQSGRVGDAMARAAKAEQQAEANAADAAAGQTLAKAIRASATAPPAAGMDALQRAGALPDEAGEQRRLADLQRLAQALFPE
ncbi:MAG: hypothetical protein JWP22_4176 [Ramlibacter sp.]|nr:hypothetical protein [Ramlibacter sp.]